MKRLASGLLALVLSSPAPAAEPVVYTLSFPEPEQRWMQVEVRLADLDPGAPLELRMSRASPGRYALHEFAKNVFSVSAVDAAGRPLRVERVGRNGWSLPGHSGSLSFSYRIFGDRVDGTYLAIDATHAHINAPAAFAWAPGLERRPIEVRLEPPPGSGWRVATQLAPTGDPLRWSAPNLQYLLDSPLEISDHLSAEFELAARVARDGVESGPSRRFRVALHHQGAADEVDALARAAERIAREQRAIFGELPDFDGVGYTFLSDYLPWASGDGMEHRNSTVLTSSGALGDPDDRRRLLGTVSHELFHAWNVERIRPASLEPFDFDDANVSGDLWLAEGFTSYYGNLVLRRAELAELSHTLDSFGSVLDTVINSPARALRSPVEMSQMAPFVDAAVSIDRTDWGNSFISYYTWGSAIALGLDLSLRQRSQGDVCLDDLMRALWERFGRAPAPAPGMVGRPWRLDDVRETLAQVSGDADFAREFVSRYIEGREVPDYAELLLRAGLSLRPKRAGRAWLGALELEFAADTARVAAPVPRDSPARRAGLAQDDVLVTLGGGAVRNAGELERLLARASPGDALELRFLRRGRIVETSVELEPDPALELVALEDTERGAPSPEQRRFREAWLGSALDGEPAS